MQIYRLGEVNLCFTYLHGNVKAKVYPWVYEVFSNAIITPPHPSMPATHACPERTELRAVLPQCWASTSSLPACLPGRALRSSRVLQCHPCQGTAGLGQVCPVAHELSSCSHGLQGKSSVLGSTTAHQDSSKAMGSPRVIRLPSRSKTVRVW